MTIRIDYNQAAAAYARYRQVHPDVLRELITRGQINSETNILEVGCGTGNYLRAIATTTGCRGWGIDPSTGMLDQARAQSDEMNFQLGRAEQLDFPAAQFELVYSVDVIHHVEDRAAFFREAERVLKPGGRLCTVTDSAEIIRRRRPLSSYFPETVAVELNRYPTINSLRELMTAAGFDQMLETNVEFAYALTDLQAYREKAFSSLHLILESAFQQGLARMNEDLKHGPIQCLSLYTLLWGTKK
jgi:ubiquinone/menaquinone biosynthesis C-methylase UbiE